MRESKMTFNLPWHKCQELKGVLQNLARVSHISHYTTDCFSIQLNSAVFCCPLNEHQP